MKENLPSILLFAAAISILLYNMSTMEDRILVANRLLSERINAFTLELEEKEEVFKKQKEKEKEEKEEKEKEEREKEKLKKAELVSSLIAWTKTIRGRKVFSQNDEDGALEAVFRKIGTTDKVYVEFGVESCQECNTRYLRENLGWDVKSSLLMDGGYENPDINLQKVIFWPDNIVELFTRFHVKKEFDLLSEDSDSYDFFMLEAILEGGYTPRVIIVEYNANFELTEAKSIMKPEKGKPWLRWDFTTYQGMSLLATKYLLERFHYSLVWCNKVNCIGVKDSVLGAEIRLDMSQLDHGRLDQHRCDGRRRPMAVIGTDGRWSGETDEGRGSPHIRCR